jgi:cbb3-type cytochrome oxidase cytochrome c subunit
MLPRTSSLTHLIIGTLLAVSTAMLTRAYPAFAIRSNHCPVDGVEIYLEIQGFDPTNVVASLDLIPHQ